MQAGFFLNRFLIAAAAAIVQGHRTLVSSLFRSGPCQRLPGSLRPQARVGALLTPWFWAPSLLDSPLLLPPALQPADAMGTAQLLVT